MSEPTAPSTGQKITGGGGGTSWTYNEETELFTKRWPKEYFELWKGVPVLWSCNHVLDKSDSYEEVWSWRWATKKRKREPLDSATERKRKRWATKKKK